MKASVVICTYARPEVVKRLLLELNGQRYQDFEVLLVCQGDKGDLERIKDSIKNIYPLRYYYEASPNLPRARNIGVKEAHGEVIIFLDDDTKPDNNLIGAHLANYTDSTIGMVGGKVFGEKHERDVSDSKIGKVRRFDGFAYGGFYKDIRCQVMHARGVNMSVRKEIALEIGGFDERFEGTAEYEDADFCLRVLKKGYKIVFDPTAVIEHFLLAFGGCRVVSREEQVYWLYRNHSLMFLNNFNKLFYPILIAEYIFRIILRGLRWRNPRIMGSAFQGIYAGWKAHFSKP